MTAMRAMSQAVGTVAERRTSRTRVMIGMTLVLLLAQFLLGMYINLFVPTPGRQPVVAAHIVLGSLLLLVALVTAGMAIASRRPVTAVLAASWPGSQAHGSSAEAATTRTRTSWLRASSSPSPAMSWPWPGVMPDGCPDVLSTRSARVGRHCEAHELLVQRT
jgi:hypothetical protein